MEKAKLEVLLELADKRHEAATAILMRLQSEALSLEQRRSSVQSRSQLTPAPRDEQESFYAFEKWSASPDALLPEIDLNIGRLAHEIEQAKLAVRQSFTKKQGLERLIEQERTHARKTEQKRQDRSIDEHGISKWIAAKRL